MSALQLNIAVNAIIVGFISYVASLELPYLSGILPLLPIIAGLQYILVTHHRSNLDLDDAFSATKQSIIPYLLFCISVVLLVSTTHLPLIIPLLVSSLVWFTTLKLSSKFGDILPVGGFLITVGIFSLIYLLAHVISGFGERGLKHFFAALLGGAVALVLTKLVRSGNAIAGLIPLLPIFLIYNIVWIQKELSTAHVVASLYSTLAALPAYSAFIFTVSKNRSGRWGTFAGGLIVYFAILFLTLWLTNINPIVRL